MKIGFSVATPEVDAPQLPAQQGDLAANLDVLAELGYDGVELSVCRPAELDVAWLEQEVTSRGLEVAAGRDEADLAQIQDDAREADVSALSPRGLDDEAPGVDGERAEIARG